MLAEKGPTYRDRYWNSPEGLKLHYRDYEGPLEGPPILCLPGLTRNARDFEPVAAAFAGRHRVIAVDFRGRGLSDHDPDPTRYHPPTYVADLLKLLDQLGIADAIFVGTSLGGIVTMLLADEEPERIAAALLNDIGPELVESGLDRIRAYVGKGVEAADWAEAAALYRAGMGHIYPRWGEPEWDRFARRMMHEEGGRLTSSYDRRIADNVVAGASQPPLDAWHLLDALKDKPVTILRGERSDLFSQEVAGRMLDHLDHADLVNVPDVGHAPSFDEPESIAALAALIDRTPD
ncbi:alpha/beta fold hydrolase [Sphingomicrobium astaxanthinifaciens]|uniref:alpha/beta fold hydrolase n=1 Tax=Sphingomicrobium astaxanthinifaciens TaxID=1227949 RepID=UPI001FCB0200|nr:alpha/beta hydrolase [Sphingomicrobium astaxanthinifaciens]MCJ7420667.1 alpha/beta hydrolase [Sphingomicrobium astaxanthinifaciens]